LKPTRTASADAAPASGEGRQRVDKWLWHARLVRTRSAAAELAKEGHVRLNGARIDTASHKVGLGDVLTVVLSRVRVVKISGFAERRGAAEAARALYEDLSPPVPPRNEASGGGPRPTKRERRAIDKLQNPHDMEG
jgi:ribosome-associated heat shock protein Hsp15